MATGRFGSPAKNMNKGYGPAKTSSPAIVSNVKLRAVEAASTDFKFFKGYIMQSFATF